MNTINKNRNSTSSAKKFKYAPDKSLLRLFVGYVAAQQAKNHPREEIIECVKILRSGTNSNLTRFQSLVKDKLKHLLPTLLASKDNVNYPNAHRKTILHIFTKLYANRSIFPQSDPSTERKVVEILLQRGASVDALDFSGSTPVHYAAANERTDLVRLMLDGFTKVNTGDGYGRTVLYTLVSNYNYAPGDSDLDAIRALVTKGAHADVMDCWGTSSFEFAVKHCLIKVLEIFGFDFSNGRQFLSLCQHAATWPAHYPEQLQHLNRLTNLSRLLKVRNEECQSTPLHYVARFNRLEAVQLFLDSGADIDAKCVDGITPLHLAVMEGHSEVAKCLIERGADLKAKDAIFNFGLIHMAACKGDEGAIDLLVEAGLSVEDEAGDGFRPLHLAAYAGRDRVIESLVGYGADVDCRTREERWTPLHLIWLKHDSIPFFDNVDEQFSWVLEYLCTLDECETWDADGIIWYEAREERVNSVTLLIQSGANPNARDSEFRTPLHLATSDFTNRTLVALLDSDARVDVKDDEDELPLTKVIEREGEDARFDSVNVLLRCGADLEELDMNENLSKSALLREHLWLLAAINLLPENFCVRVGLPLVDAWMENLRWKIEVRERELRKLEMHCLTDGKTSLCDFLRMDWRRRDGLAREILSIDLKSEYPLYHVVVENSCRQAVNQRVILDLATSILNEVVGIELPYICAEKIFSFLRKSDMTTFVDSVKRF